MAATTAASDARAMRVLAAVVVMGCGTAVLHPPDGAAMACRRALRGIAALDAQAPPLPAGCTAADVAAVLDRDPHFAVDGELPFATALARYRTRAPHGRRRFAVWTRAGGALAALDLRGRAPDAYLAALGPPDDTIDEARVWLARGVAATDYRVVWFAPTTRARYVRAIATLRVHRDEDDDDCGGPDC